MIDGYLSGFTNPRHYMPLLIQKQSVAFRHGWKNGRDDKLGYINFNDSASSLKARARIILEN